MRGKCILKKQCIIHPFQKDMTTWEYKICDYPKLTMSDIGKIPHMELIQAMLNKMGADGWELVRIGNLNLVGEFTLYTNEKCTFKRPLK